MNTNLFDLTGKVAIVTGGSRGLGREIAMAFAAHGATVVVSSRKIEACEEVVSAITLAGGAAHAIACHVGHWADCDALIGRTVELCGRIDVLVNNAGMSPLYPSLTEITEALFDKVIDVNLKGPFRLSALAAEQMKAQGAGSIINRQLRKSLMAQPRLVSIL